MAERSKCRETVATLQDELGLQQRQPGQASINQRNGWRRATVCIYVLSDACFDTSEEMLLKIVCVCVCVCAGWAVDAAATGFHEGACVCVYALNWWFCYVRRNIKMCSPHEQLVRRCASGRSLKTNWRVKRKNGSNAFGARSYLNHSSCALYFWKKC